MRTLIALCLPLLLAACANTATPNYDQRFGDAVRQARQRQTLNPAASTEAAPATGLDGKSAQEAVILYQNTFKAPPPVVNVINIGGSPGSR
jgi:predicted Zn-dependent protease